MGRHPLLQAIDRRRETWPHRRGTDIAPTEREKRVLQTLDENSHVVAPLWNLLRKQNGRWPRTEDDDGVLNLLIDSANFADGPFGSQSRPNEIDERYGKLLEATKSLMQHYLRRGDYNYPDIKHDQPLGDEHPPLYRHLWYLMQIWADLKSTRNSLYHDALYVPTRPESSSGNHRARSFEHIFSSFLDRHYGRTWDELVTGLSQILYEADTIDRRTLQEFRKADLERDIQGPREFTAEFVEAVRVELERKFGPKQKDT